MHIQPGQSERERSIWLWILTQSHTSNVSGFSELAITFWFLDYFSSAGPTTTHSLVGTSSTLGLEPKTVTATAIITVTPTPESGSTSRASAPGALVGGILGGLSLFAVLVICFILRRRLKSSQSPFLITMPPQQRQLEATKDRKAVIMAFQGARSDTCSMTARNGIISRILFPFHHQSIQGSIAHPLVYSEDYRPPENKRGMPLASDSYKKLM